MGISGSCVRRHDQHYVAEVHFSALVVRDHRVVHDLEEEVVDVLMCLFDLIKEENTVWVLPDGLCQDTSVVVADISGRGSYKLRN